MLNEDEKQRVWQVLTNEFGHKLVKAGG